MLKKLHLICSYLIIALGVVHILFTVCVYDNFSLDAFWFIGSGLAIVFAGFLNLMFLKFTRKDLTVWILCLLGNLFSTGFFVVGLFVIGEPQVFVGTLLFSFAALATFLNRGTEKTTNEY
ncbi:MAG: hypothetical protein M3525_10475 [Acidobacteriota bacterium]|jgi:hypothetical protein|nr:hypothetical protein [Acidobacteriota bacterium]